MVTYSDEQHQILATWVAAQRAHFGKGSIEETRKQRLNELNFTWKVKKEPLRQEAKATPSEEIHETKAC